MSLKINKPIWVANPTPPGNSIWVQKNRSTTPDWSDSYTDVKKSGAPDKSEDYVKQTFGINGNGDSFECVPADTTNFKVFCLVNQHKFGEQTAHEIWEYYREKFIVAKMRNIHLTSFRAALEEFVTEKEISDYIRKSTNPFELYPGEARTRKSQIKNSIGLARYLELQYNVDTTIESMASHISPTELELNAAPIIKFKGYEPNDLKSYFTQETLELPDQDYTSNTVNLKQVYRWIHRDTINYICESKFGPVKLSLSKSAKSVSRLFDKMLRDGVDVIILQASLRTNIDGVPFLHAERWFVQ